MLLLVFFPLTPPPTGSRGGLGLVKCGESCRIDPQKSRFHDAQGGILDFGPDFGLESGHECKWESNPGVAATSGEPALRQVKAREIIEQLLADMRSGRYTGAGKLPSEAMLCRRFGVARGTVRVALEALRREGLIKTRDGAGSFLTRIAGRQTGLLGLVMPDYGRFGFFAQIGRHIESRARKMRFHVRLEVARETDPLRVLEEMLDKARQLVADHVEGVVFRPMLTPCGDSANVRVARVFQEAETPLVLLDEDLVQPPGRSEFDLVAVNNVNAGRRIAAHLLARGYRRIAFLMGRDAALARNANWNNRLFGLGGELALRGAQDAIRILRCDPGNAAAIARVMKGPSRPEVIVCGNDEAAIALMDAMRGLGLSVPGDVALVGFDDLECARSCSPPLTTIRQPADLIAATALKMLVARIRAPGGDPREIYLPAPLVIRKST